MEQSSISIINRNNGQVDGESLNALPIRMVTNLSNYKIFGLGFLSAFIFMFVFVSIIKRQVVVVEVAGKSTDYQEYKIN